RREDGQIAHRRWILVGVDDGDGARTARGVDRHAVGIAPRPRRGCCELIDARDRGWRLVEIPRVGRPPRLLGRHPTRKLCAGSAGIGNEVPEVRMNLDADVFGLLDARIRDHRVAAAPNELAVSLACGQRAEGGCAGQREERVEATLWCHGSPYLAD